MWPIIWEPVAWLLNRFIFILPKEVWNSCIANTCIHCGEELTVLGFNEFILFIFVKVFHFHRLVPFFTNIYSHWCEGCAGVCLGVFRCVRFYLQVCMIFECCDKVSSKTPSPCRNERSHNSMCSVLLFFYFNVCDFSFSKIVAFKIF